MVSFEAENYFVLGLMIGFVFACFCFWCYLKLKSFLGGHAP